MKSSAPSLLFRVDDLLHLGTDTLFIACKLMMMTMTMTMMEMVMVIRTKRGTGTPLALLAAPKGFPISFLDSSRASSCKNLRPRITDRPTSLPISPTADSLCVRYTTLQVFELECQYSRFDPRDTRPRQTRTPLVSPPLSAGGHGARTENACDVSLTRLSVIDRCLLF
ncbi:hypothetical protein VTK26DRAFT_9061 [Humicola hyalothermophila]